MESYTVPVTKHPCSLQEACPTAKSFPAHSKEPAAWQKNSPRAARSLGNAPGPPRSLQGTWGTHPGSPARRTEDGKQRNN